MGSPTKDSETFQPKERNEWRSWLEANHGTSKGIWVIYHKKASGKQTFTYEEAVEEALCFGWIDSLARPIDEARYMQRFTPRKKGSMWSSTNKARVDRLIDRGLMTPAGLAKIEEAKADGSWSMLDAIEDLVIPEDLARALDADPQAKANFNSYPDSHKKQYLYWLMGAKRPETRTKRIAQIIDLVRKKGTLAQYMNAKRSP